jgi:hypothetical protein
MLLHSIGVIIVKKLLIGIVLFVSAHAVFAQNVEKLTYYVNGRSRTVNAVYVGMQLSAFYLDAGGNIAQRTTILPADGDDWTNPTDDGIIQRRIPGMDSLAGVYGFLGARFDFYSAVERRENGTRISSVYLKNDSDDFIWFDREYVYTLQKIYAVK